MSPEFRKSTYSSADRECVEVATNHPHLIAIRDSKNPTGPILQLSPIAWISFRTAVRSGWFEH
ncbi:DUF397 domain-containing protein [Streptomyces monomycini]|uniref:DUF397 domain-containing protein n=1 Tax=Streptomyces monomycini TaxID=371720 RepID=UPI000518C04F|nr:DUF397 domain-containing protein [Streptomyces monomycini]